MPKSQTTPAVSDPLAAYPRVLIGGGHPGLPPGLAITGQFYAALLPDGRAVPEGLPPDALAQFYPDLAPVTPDVAPPPQLQEI